MSLRRTAVFLLCAWVFFSAAFAGKVVGRVTAKTGEPIEGASVTLVPKDQARASRQTLKTNKDGRYLFGIVPDGDFTVEVSYEDRVPGEIKLTVFDLAEKKNVVEYSGPPPSTPKPFSMNINTTATYDFVLIPRSETPQAMAEKRQADFNEVPGMLGEGKFQEALTRIDDALKVRPDSPDLHYLRSYALFRLNDNENARGAARKALELRADQPGAHFVLAGTFLAEEKKPEALAEFEAEIGNAATDENTRTRALLSAGELHRELGHSDQAIAAFERVTQADPKIPDAWNALAELYLKTNQHDKAAAAQVHAKESGQEDPIMVFNLGAEAWNRKDFAKAAEYFRHATELDPQFALAWKNLGYAHVNLGNADEARKSLGKYLELSPKAEDAGEVKEMIAALGKS